MWTVSFISASEPYFNAVEKKKNFGAAIHQPLAFPKGSLFPKKTNK